MDEWNSTVLNKEVYTEVNVTACPSELNADNMTVLNDYTSPQGGIVAGTVLCGKYTVSQKMEISTGEADLYICQYDGETYVAKVYRRAAAIKQEVSDTLKSLDSPYIARVYETGSFGEYAVEILPFYKYGSLQGKRFDFGQLKEKVIPCLNEGLRILHSKGILHKDLKPSNIMVSDRQEHVALIDFGISSMREDGNTIVMTRTGMTPEYSAPETFKNLYLEESDYYSLGITIYELFCGVTPFRHMGPEEIERYVSVQKIPFPKEMPEELKDLISALTYYDITNRKTKANPNRRWGYEEVKRWCAGEKMVVPGESSGNIKGMPPYTLGQITYIDKQELVYALVEQWEEGKKQLFRGLLSAFFKTFDPQAAGFCLDAEEEASRLYGKDEILYWHTLYQLSGTTRELFWRGRIYSGLPELGREILSKLPAEDIREREFWGSILENRILSAYIERMEGEPSGMLEAVKGLEAAYRSHYKKRDKIMYLYLMGFMLSGEHVLCLAGRRFETVSQFTGYMKEMMTDSYENFTGFCHQLLDEEDNPDPQLEGWLIALGKEAKLEQWRQGR